MSIRSIGDGHGERNGQADPLRISKGREQEKNTTACCSPWRSLDATPYITTIIAFAAPDLRESFIALGKRMACGPSSPQSDDDNMRCSGPFTDQISRSINLGQRRERQPEDR